MCRDVNVGYKKPRYYFAFSRAIFPLRSTCARENPCDKLNKHNVAQMLLLDVAMWEICIANRLVARKTRKTHLALFKLRRRTVSFARRLEKSRDIKVNKTTRGWNVTFSRFKKKNAKNCYLIKEKKLLVRIRTFCDCKARSRNVVEMMITSDKSECYYDFTARPRSSRKDTGIMAADIG